jgi:hypothetical protein
MAVLLSSSRTTPSSSASSARISAGVQPGSLITCNQTVFFECFPYVCPEPVWVKSSFSYAKGSRRPFCYLIRTNVKDLHTHTHTGERKPNTAAVSSSLSSQQYIQKASIFCQDRLGTHTQVMGPERKKERVGISTHLVRKECGHLPEKNVPFVEFFPTFVPSLSWQNDLVFLV